jgi:hypothetical protein
MKRQQLEKLIGKKLTGGYRQGMGKARGGAKGPAAPQPQDGERKQPIAVRLIQGLGKK